MNISVPFYNNALSFAAIMISKNKAYEITTNFDVVHNAIISPNFNENTWRNIIAGEVKKAVVATPVVSFYDTYSKNNIDDSRVCYKCGDTHSSSSFKAGFNEKLGVIQYRNSCKLCHKEIRKGYAKKALTIEQKAKQLIQVKEYRKNNVDTTRNERVKLYWSKQKATLGDAYILKLLRGKKKKHIQFTAEDIAEKRNDILSKI